MRICLIPLQTEVGQPAINFERVKERLNEAKAHRPQLVCLPECTLTGYLWREEDLKKFAEPLSGTSVRKMSELAHAHAVYLCFGMVEAAEEGFYNTAVLLNPSGQVIHVHRKVSEQPPYLQGTQVSGVDTEIGRLGILICGDHFHDQTIAHLDSPIQLLLVPMSRGFDGKSPDPQRWINEERQAYLDAVKKAAKVTAIVNALENLPEEAAFGGALVVSAQGELLAESPHGSDQILIYDLAD